MKELKNCNDQHPFLSSVSVLNSILKPHCRTCQCSSTVQGADMNTLSFAGMGMLGSQTYPCRVTKHWNSILLEKFLCKEASRNCHLTCLLDSIEKIICAPWRKRLYCKAHLACRTQMVCDWGWHGCSLSPHSKLSLKASLGNGKITNFK